MKNGWYRITYLIALLLISISFGFSASIWSTTPSLGYLAIFISSIFEIVMTFSWCSTLWKSKYGKLTLIINGTIGLMSIGFLMKKSGGFEDYQRYLNIFGNILAAISTLIFGMINYIKINTHTRTVNKLAQQHTRKIALLRIAANRSSKTLSSLTLLNSIKK